MIEIALLTTALLFGGMVLYSFAFAPFLFNTLPAETAGPLIRKAFPHFYLFVLGTSALAGAMVAVSGDTRSAILLAVIALTTVYARQILMPSINAATDAKKSGRFKALHGFSVLITLAHIGVAGVVLIRLAST
ncbi:MAG: DUF4149 domain-containing protein [Pseudomonadota bacterium]